MSCAPTPKLFCLRGVQSLLSLVCYSRWSPIERARENFRFICPTKRKYRIYLCFTL